MFNPNSNGFVPHTSEEDLGFSGSWRPMMSAAVTERKIKIETLGKSSKDKGLNGVIMPSFNWSMNPMDPAFRGAHSAHMSNQPDPKKTVHFLPTAWATAWKCYTFQGPANEHFISPACRAMMMGGDQVDRDLLRDAFDDIYLHIKRNPNLTKTEKEYYLKKEDVTTDAKVPLVERKYFCNALVRDKDRKEDAHVILMFTGSAYNYLIEQMRWATRFGGTPLSQDWPAYLIGDPTDPNGALVWRQDKMKVGGLAMESNVICYTDQPEQLNDRLDRRNISAAQLEGRVNLYDQDSWNWPTYQEMADFALEHWTEVPRDFIAEACSHMACVGQRSKKAVVSDGGGSPQTSGGVGNRNQPSGIAYTPPSTPPPATVVEQPSPPPAAPQPAPQQAPLPPAPNPPPAPPVEETYWVNLNGESVKRGLSYLTELVQSGRATSELVYINNDWVGLKESGLVKAPLPASPPPPDTPLPPVGANSDALRQKISDYVPNLDSMAPDKQEKVKDIIAKIYFHETSNPGVPTPSELSMELGTLLMG